MVRFGLLWLLLAACYEPRVRSGSPCVDGKCPAGLVCAATATCEPSDVDAPIDLAIDVPVEPGSMTFATMGMHAFVVPTGVGTITVKAWGAGGGTCNDLGGAEGKGGAGAFATGSLTVTPGETLTIIVGQGGAFKGGPTIGGGAGSTGTGPSIDGASGGGRSAVERQALPLLVAGGGGGGGGGSGGTYFGGDGGAGGAADGNAGTASTGGGAGGGGGTQMTAGAGGAATNGPDGTSGDRGTGGAPGLDGGGGGGGYFGGGGGEGSGSTMCCSLAGGGGGGGSSLIPMGGTAIAGTGSTPGNAMDPDRGGAGNADMAGKIIVSW